MWPRRDYTARRFYHRRAVPLLLVLALSLALGALPGPRVHSSTTARQASATALSIPRSSAMVALDGVCDVEAEYAAAYRAGFTDAYGQQAQVYLQHDAGYLYICMLGAAGSDADRFASVYLDRDNAREKVAEQDDFALRVSISKAFTESLHGTGAYAGYEPFSLAGWDARAGAGNADVAEYAVELGLVSSACDAPFGLAVYHHSVASAGDDYGWPSAQSYDQPQTWREVALAEPPCSAPPDPQQQALQRLEQRSLRAPRVRFEQGIPRFVAMELPFPDALPEDPVARALHVLKEYKDLYRIADPEGELFLQRVIDDTGSSGQASPEETHLFFGQHKQGVPVFGAALGVHIEGDRLLSSNGNYLPELAALPPPVPLFKAQAAEEVALKVVPGTNAAAYGEPELYYVNPALLGEPDQRTSLAWRVIVRGTRAADGVETSWLVFIDARDGRVVLWFDEQPSERGFMAISADRPGEDFYIATADNSRSRWCRRDVADVVGGQWFDEDGSTGYPGDAADDFADGRDAFNLTHGTYHYFYDRFALRSWDDDDEQVVAMVHVGSEWQNAQYSPSCDELRFGDGWVAQDVFAHEFTHAVTQHSSNLVYLNQSGALDESFSDFFGAMLDGNWTVGEEIPAASGGGPFRDMSNPPRFNSCRNSETCYTHPDHIDNLARTGRWDNGGVHINSGIPNKVAFLISEGGTHNGIPVSGMGRIKAQQLYYAVLTQRLASNAQFLDARDALLEQATRFAFHGRHLFTIEQVCTVRNAFASVGLAEADVDCDETLDTIESDADGDRIWDSIDNCPPIANPRQSDIDDDGIGDVCDNDDDDDTKPDTEDNCPTVYNRSQYDADGDGIGEHCDDDDSDGVFNLQDNCSGQFNPGQEDNDGDRRGDVCDYDDDNDEVSDVLDNCRTTPNPDQQDSDGDGVGDACDNCSEHNPDQEDTDSDGIGNVCDDDDDDDAIVDAEDNCPTVFDPHAIDIDGNGKGLVCDESEAALLGGGYLSGALRFERLDAPIRIPIQPCLADGCPDWLPADMRTSVNMQLGLDAPARVMNSHGHTVNKASARDPYALHFKPSADSFYRIPGRTLLQGAAASTPGVYRGTSYYLEILPPADAEIGKQYAVSIAVNEFGVRRQLLPAVAR